MNKQTIYSPNARRNNGKKMNGLADHEDHLPMRKLILDSGPRGRLRLLDLVQHSSLHGSGA